MLPGYIGLVGLITLVLGQVRVDGFILGLPKAASSPWLIARDLSKLRSQYDGIDSSFSEKVPNGNVNATMKMIEEWIKRESSHELNPNEAVRLRALIQLHSLVQIEGEGSCTLSSSRILQNNDLALRSAISKLKYGEVPKRRIEKFVNYYASRFERECDHQVVLKDMNRQELQNLAKIIGELVGARAGEESPLLIWQSRIYQPNKLLEEQPLQASNFARTMRGLRPVKDALIVSNWLTDVAKTNYDPMLRFLQNVDKSSKSTIGSGVNKLYGKYLGKPCERFIEKVECIFGNSWALAQSEKMHIRMNSEDSFYRSLTLYHGCKLVLTNEGKLVESLKSVALNNV